MGTLILASGSPRRKELMGLMPWPFEIKVKEVEEIVSKELTPVENVKALALQKARATAEFDQDHFVIGADTIVCLEGEMMGKPHEADCAKEMLRRLSGKKHQVYTGVAIICEEKQIEEVFYVETSVKMQEMTETEIESYVATNEPLDKAGAYGIQGYGARYIEGIVGDYYNVMGLPVHEVYQKLMKYMK